MNWLEHPTTTMPVAEFVCLVGWAAFATVLAVWLHWRCWRWHYGTADLEMTVTERATIPATVADTGRDTEKAAS